MSGQVSGGQRRGRGASEWDEVGGKPGRPGAGRAVIGFMLWEDHWLPCGGTLTPGTDVGGLSVPEWRWWRVATAQCPGGGKELDPGVPGS